MDTTKSLLARHGLAVVKNGYEVVPLEAGEKRPKLLGWTKEQTRDENEKALRDWAKVPGRGVGITTRNTPAVDIDIRDEEVAQLVDDFVVELLGEGPMRVGRWPKRLRVFRTDEPFAKLASPRYSEDAVQTHDGGKAKWRALGDIHQVEILGDGQQFAAYHVHPDIQRPYQWRTEDTHPAITPADDLPTITVEQARQIIDYFVELAEERGWVAMTKGRLGRVTQAGDDDDWTVGIKEPLPISIEEVRNDLMSLEGREGYDGWFEVLAALYHQTQGSEDGRTLAHEWCAELSNYDADEIDEKWDGGHLEARPGKEPVTWRSIKHYLKGEAADKKVATVQGLKAAFRNAKDMQDWEDVAQEVRKAEIDLIARESLVDIARDQYSIISGNRVSVVVVRKRLAYEMDTRKMPDWCSEFVYDTSDDSFVNMVTKECLTVSGFNATYDRLALTKKDRLEGRAKPAHRAAELALNTYRIPVVGGRMYLPGESEIFTFNGVKHVNLYREDLVPEVPERLRPVDKKNIKIVRAHVANLLPNEEEQQLFIDWFAWITQNPGKLVRWAILLQGVPGDGKSFFGEMMRVVLGYCNVRSIDANALESDFQDWSQGSCLICVEEVKMHGVDSYDILNRNKTRITNRFISVNPKGKKEREIVNTGNQFLTSNYINSIPITDDDRRYCVLNTRFHSAAEYRRFRDENPGYYEALFQAIEDSGPALRKWLLDWEVSDTFPAGAIAPITKGRAKMIAASRPQFLRDMDEVVKQGEFETVTEDLVSVTELADVLIGQDSDMPVRNKLHFIMTQNGYTELGRFKYLDRLHRFWSKRPELFLDGGHASFNKITKYLKARRLEIDNDQL